MREERAGQKGGSRNKAQVAVDGVGVCLCFLPSAEACCIANSKGNAWSAPAKLLWFVAVQCQANWRCLSHSSNFMLHSWDPPTGLFRLWFTECSAEGLAYGFQRRDFIFSLSKILKTSTFSACLKYSRLQHPGHGHVFFCLLVLM